MNIRLKRMLNGARAIESRLATAFEQAAHTVAGATGPEPLELVDAASDEVARSVQPAGRGRYVFPFNSVTITFVAGTTEDQARFEAICEGPPTVRDRVLRRLTSAGCNDADVDVTVSFAAEPDSSWIRPEFHVALARVNPAARQPRPSGPEVRVDLLVTNGTADRGAYTFTTLPIAIGRGPEVRDSRSQLLRINHVAFTEGADNPDADAGVNRSVSRRHARIELDPHTRRPRLIDDNSAQGTSVLRHGRGIVVPRGSRGLGLQSDDEIVLGQARLRVRISTHGGTE